MGRRDAFGTGISWLLRMLRPKPRLSMVVATYNVGPYLEAFFESLKCQTDGFAELEIIIVNDGATDHSGQIAKNWVERFPKTIRYVVQDNQGVAAARNAGLALATGEWVCFPDPDDFLSPDYLAQMRREILRPRLTRLLAVTAQLVYYYEETNTYGDEHPLRNRFKNGLRRYNSSKMGDVILPHTSSTFMRRQDIISLGLTFDTRVRPSFEDGHFITRLLMYCPQRTVSFLPKPIYYYRKRAAGTSIIDGIVRNPEWYAPHLEHAYLSLLKDAEARYGNIPQYVQNNILFSLLAKLRYLTGPNFDPSILDHTQRMLFQQKLLAVMTYISPDTLVHAKIQGFYPLHRRALTALYKETQLSAPEIILKNFNPDSQEVNLRWVTGGAEVSRVKFKINGTAIPINTCRCTERWLFDTLYGRIHTQRLSLTSGQELRAFVNDLPMPIQYGKSRETLYLSLDMLKIN